MKITLLLIAALISCVAAARTGLLRVGNAAHLTTEKSAARRALAFEEDFRR